MEQTHSRLNWLLIGLIALLMAVLLAPVSRWLLSEWWSNDYYSHGLLVPLVSGFFAWRIMPRLARQPDDRGLLLVGVSALGYVAMLYSRSFHFAALAMILLLAGVIWTYWGWPGLKKMLFPLGFLIFMIPFPFVEVSSLPLSLLTGQIATRLMQAAGLNVTVQGAAVSLPHANLVVGAQCSGVRSIVTLFTLAAIYAYLVQGALMRKLILFLAVLPIAVLGNLFRVSSLLGVANRWGVEAGFTYYHDYSGFVFFGIAFALLILFAQLLGCSKIRNDL